MPIWLRAKRHPAAIQQLVHFRQAVSRIPQSGIQVLAIALPQIVAATGLSHRFGLLTNDALTAAVMQANGLDKLASNDSDFDRVPGIVRYAPT